MFFVEYFMMLSVTICRKHWQGGDCNPITVSGIEVEWLKKLRETSVKAADVPEYHLLARPTWSIRRCLTIGHITTFYQRQRCSWVGWDRRMIAVMYHRLEKNTLWAALRYYPRIPVQGLRKRSGETPCPGFLSFFLRYFTRYIVFPSFLRIHMSDGGNY
jgi:hypothetical protein